jgi:hypothetical protein
MPNMSLQPVRAAPEVPHRTHLHRLPLVQGNLRAKIYSPVERAQLVHHLERALGIAILHRGDVGEIVELLPRCLLEPGEDVMRPLPRQIHDGIAAGDQVAFDGGAKLCPKGADTERRRAHRARSGPFAEPALRDVGLRVTMRLVTDISG